MVVWLFMVVSDNKSYKIQLLRGLAIIAVVVIHSTPGGLAQIWCRPLLNFAVGMFLFLSGMLSNANKWNPGVRFFKVVVPYIIWTMVYVLIENFKIPTKIPSVYLYDLLTGKSASIMYYVFVYCQFTFLIPLIDKLGKSKYRYVGFLISPLEIIFVRLIPLIIGYEINEVIRIIMSLSCLGWFTYYYLGYLLGNGMLRLKITTPNLVLIHFVGIILQILEGYWYYSMGEVNCGTQLKLSAILTGTIFVLLGYRFITSEKKVMAKMLYFLGNYSFGIYFSHLAVMSFLNYIPFYSEYIKYPLNAISVIVISFLFVFIGRKMLGKYSKYFAF